ncbi:MAG: 3-dehydroquinate synthase II [Candidatus Methylomirabilia bacterium]
MDTLKRPELWIDLSSRASGEPEILSAILHFPLSGLLVSPLEDLPVEIPSHIRRGWMIREGREFAALPGQGEMVVTLSREIAGQARTRGHPVGVSCRVTDPQTLEEALALLDQVDYLFIRLADETNIPLELILTRAQGRRVRVIKTVGGLEEAAVALGVLEHGCHGILVAPQDLGTLARIAHELSRRPSHQLSLVEVEVVGIEHAGMGHRACVDTLTMMADDEGMVVGSTSNGGILVCSEVHPLPYMNTRPFRVNAGAIHSYLWGPEDSASYLSDLRAGSGVLVVRTSGEAKAVRVGRVKIEVRPLVKIHGIANGTPLSLFVQHDWHVRIFGADGKPRSVTSLKPGEKVLGHLCEPGRHVGIKISETILER